jgi:hypothetical protein
MTAKDPKENNRRKYPRFGINIPIRFNLNPQYHFVPEVRKMGVGGSVRNICREGLMIHSRMDLLDVCQIFYEAMEEDSPFELEVVVADFRGKRLLLRGSVRWYQLTDPDGGIRRFQAGLYLKDSESRSCARGIVKSIAEKTVTDVA